MGGGWGLFYFSFAFSRGIVSIPSETCSESLALHFVSFGPVQASSSEGRSPSGSLVMNILLQLGKAGASTESSNIQFHQCERLAEQGAGRCLGCPPRRAPIPITQRAQRRTGLLRAVGRDVLWGLLHGLTLTLISHAAHPRVADKLRGHYSDEV